MPDRKTSEISSTGTLIVSKPAGIDSVPLSAEELMRRRYVMPDDDDQSEEEVEEQDDN